MASPRTGGLRVAICRAKASSTVRDWTARMPQTQPAGQGRGWNLARLPSWNQRVTLTFPPGLHSTPGIFRVFCVAWNGATILELRIDHIRHAVSGSDSGT